ncbi:DUF2157 domain-containing protein [Paenalkalicoccus suaedae]|uniref:DUF2157 domain-containing protein n=1 Tax=Paenalkalicoccus suaedae TaxID=2592382 RepID=A0A859FIE3_9BACI|nr:DUF2157 domain-containing protein [Paenalkalicoccus suaedae]QKS72891.1 DUF2157 domain-containing protein [Paenalkalicoccus suaedae]
MISLPARYVKWTYIIGISFMLAAIIYYFQSNWYLYPRLVQVSLITGLVFAFFVAAIMTQRISPRFVFLSSVMLTAGFISYGVALGVIGDIYHSQSQLYWLFLIWLLPTFLAAVASKQPALQLLSFALLQATILSYLTPTYETRSDWVLLLGFIVASLLSVALFYLTRKNERVQAMIPYAFFAMAHVYGLIISTRFVLESLNGFAHIYYLLLLGASFALFRRDTWIFRLTIIAGIFYIARQILSYLIDIDVALIFLLIAAGAIGVVVAGVKVLNQHSDKVIATKQASRTFILRVITVGAAAVAAGAITGFLFIVLQDISGTFLGILSAASFFTALLLRKNSDSYVQFFVLFGSFFMLATLLDFWGVLAITWIVPLIWLYLRVKDAYTRTLVFLSFNMAVVLWVSFTFNSGELAAGILTVAAGIGAIIAYKSAFRLPYLHALFIFYVYFYSLPFTVWDRGPRYFIYVSSFLLIVTALLYWHVRLKDKGGIVLTATFWFIFLFYQYVDLLWENLPATFTFALLGAIFLIAAVILDRGETIEAVRPKFTVVTIVAMVLTFGLMAVPVATSEAALRDGQSIVVAIDNPYDSYYGYNNVVYLSYPFERIDETSGATSGKPVYVGLVDEEDGRHVFDGDIRYSLDDANPDTVYLRGIDSGYGYADFGISSYRVETEDEAEIDAVELLVGSDGIAIIEGLVEAE